MWTIAIGAICAGYVAIRLWRLTDPCLWFDEIFSVHAAGQSWDSILWFVSLDLIHPPLFYVLLKLWVGIGGESLHWLRLFPVLFSVIAIFPFISLCRELKLARSTQVLALFMLAINGSLIKYAQEVRMYSLLMCLSLFSLWLFARYFVKGKSFIPLVIVNVLMVYTHYFGWFVVLSEVVLIAWFQRIKWRRIVLMIAITFASFLPWVAAVFAASRSGSGLEQNIGWMSRPGIREVVTFVFNIIEPFYFQTSSDQAVSAFRITLPLLALIVAVAGLFLGHWKKLTETEQSHAYFLLIFIKLPVAAVFVSSWLLPYSLWGTRHLIIVFAPFCIYLAMILASSANKCITSAVIGLLLLFSGLGFTLYVSAERLPNAWCGVDELAKEWVMVPHYSAAPRIVVATEDLIAYHVWYATREFPNLEIHVLNDLPGVREDKAYFLPRGFDGVRRVNLDDISLMQDFWVAFRDTDERSPGIAAFTERPKVMRELEYLGFEVGQQRSRQLGNETVTFVRMTRRPAP